MQWKIKKRFPLSCVDFSRCNFHVYSMQTGKKNTRTNRKTRKRDFLRVGKTVSPDFRFARFSVQNRRRWKRQGKSKNARENKEPFSFILRTFFAMNFPLSCVYFSRCIFLHRAYIFHDSFPTSTQCRQEKQKKKNKIQKYTKKSESRGKNKEFSSLAGNSSPQTFVFPQTRFSAWNRCRWKERKKKTERIQNRGEK